MYCLIGMCSSRTVWEIFSWAVLMTLFLIWGLRWKLSNVYSRLLLLVRLDYFFILSASEEIGELVLSGLMSVDITNLQRQQFVLFFFLLSSLSLECGNTLSTTSITTEEYNARLLWCALAIWFSGHPNHLLAPQLWTIRAFDYVYCLKSKL